MAHREREVRRTERFCGTINIIAPTFLLDHHAGLSALQPGTKPQWASRLRHLQRAIRRSDGFADQPVGKQAIGHHYGKGRADGRGLEETEDFQYLGEARGHFPLPRPSRD